MKQILSFTAKWLNKFQDEQINFIELVDHHLSDDCKALGFEMDCGSSFSKKYGCGIGNTEALRNIINQVTDIQSLGAAIYSEWRYFNHWAYDAAEILKPKNREWFIIALTKLAELANQQLTSLDKENRINKSLAEPSKQQNRCPAQQKPRHRP